MSLLERFRTIFLYAGYWRLWRQEARKKYYQRHFQRDGIFKHSVGVPNEQFVARGVKISGLGSAASPGKSRPDPGRAERIPSGIFLVAKHAFRLSRALWRGTTFLGMSRL